MSVQDLPTVNAALNLSSAVLLLSGYRFIRQGRRDAHITCMLAALGCSVLFLTSYLVYHFQVGSVRYPGTGLLRTVYLGILLTHTVLAAVNLPLVLVAVSRAARGQFERHRAIARVTFPIWLYVSVTGVVIYLMLYRLPAA